MALFIFFCKTCMKHYDRCMLYKSVINSGNYCNIVGYILVSLMYGLDVAILLMFESRVERHSFCGIETLNGYMYYVG